MFMVSSLNYQVTFVKDQQDDIKAKLHAEFLALEEEISGLGMEVSLSLPVPDALLLFPQITNFHSVLSYTLQCVTNPHV